MANLYSALRWKDVETVQELFADSYSVGQIARGLLMGNGSVEHCIEYLLSGACDNMPSKEQEDLKVIVMATKNQQQPQQRQPIPPVPHSVPAPPAPKPQPEAPPQSMTIGKVENNMDAMVIAMKSVLGEDADEEKMRQCLVATRGNVELAVSIYFDFEKVQIEQTFGPQFTLPFVPLRHPATGEIIPPDQVSALLPGMLAHHAKTEANAAAVAMAAPFPSLPNPFVNPSSSAAASFASASPSNLNSFGRPPPTASAMKTMPVGAHIPSSMFQAMMSTLPQSIQAKATALPPPAPPPPAIRAPGFQSASMIGKQPPPPMQYYQNPPPPPPRMNSQSAKEERDTIAAMFPHLQKPQASASSSSSSGSKFIDMTADITPPPPPPSANSFVFTQTEPKRDSDGYPRLLGVLICDVTVTAGGPVDIARLSSADLQRLSLLRIPMDEDYSIAIRTPMSHIVARISHVQTSVLTPLIDSGRAVLSFKIERTGRAYHGVPIFILGAQVWGTREFFSTSPAEGFMDPEGRVNRGKGKNKISLEEEQRIKKDKKVRLATIGLMRQLYPVLNQDQYKLKSAAGGSSSSYSSSSSFSSSSSSSSSSSAASSSSSSSSSARGKRKNEDGEDADDADEKVVDEEVDGSAGAGEDDAVRSELEKQVVSMLGHTGDLEHMPTIERPPHLLPHIVLRKYQQQALWWMLRRECKSKAAFEIAFQEYLIGLNAWKQEEEKKKQFDEEEKRKHQQKNKKEKRESGGGLEDKYSMKLDIFSQDEEEDEEQEEEQEALADVPKKPLKLISDSDDEMEEEDDDDEDDDLSYAPSASSAAAAAAASSSSSRGKAPASSQRQLSLNSFMKSSSSSSGSELLYVAPKPAASSSYVNKYPDPAKLLKTLMAAAERGLPDEFSQMPEEDGADEEEDDDVIEIEDSDDEEAKAKRERKAKREEAKKLHPLFVRLTTPLKETIYFNPYSGQCLSLKPEAPAEPSGGILADEMGLGKTLQMISLILAHPPKRDSKAPTLIVCPTSLLDNWREEIRKFSGEKLSVFTYHGKEKSDEQARRKKAKLLKSSSASGSKGSNLDLEEYDVVITSYGTLLGEYKKTFDVESKKPKVAPKDFSFFYSTNFHRMILDEAHVIKNRNASTNLACCAVKSKYRWSVTGTVIQNSLDDLFSQLKFLQAKPFDEFQWFNRLIGRPFEKDNDETAGIRLRALMKPIFLQRTKDLKYDGEPLIALPPRTEETVWLDLSEEERDFYDFIEKNAQTKIEAFIEEGSIGHNYACILELMLRLRQALDHPALCLPSLVAGKKGESLDEKADRHSLLAELQKFLGQQGAASDFAKEVESLINGEEDSECPVCMDLIGISEGRGRVITTCMHAYCVDCINGVLHTGLVAGRPSVDCPQCRKPFTMADIKAIPRPEKEATPPESEEEKARKARERKAKAKSWVAAAKLRELAKNLEEIRQRGDKSIVFSQFTSYLNIVESALMENGIQFVRLDGTMNREARREAIAAFRDKPHVTVFLVSLMAGGTGLNLVSANHCFLLDPWWNPAVESQAIARCHRIGQTKPVFVKRFLINQSFEQRMLDIKTKKEALAKAATTGSSLAEIKKLSVSDIRHLFGLSVRGRGGASSS